MRSAESSSRNALAVFFHGAVASLACDSCVSPDSEKNVQPESAEAILQ